MLVMMARSNAAALLAARFIFNQMLADFKNGVFINQIQAIRQKEDHQGLPDDLLFILLIRLDIPKLSCLHHLC